MGKAQYNRPPRYKKAYISSFWYRKYYLFFYTTCYPNKEVICIRLGCKGSMRHDTSLFWPIVSDEEKSKTWTKMRQCREALQTGSFSTIDIDLLVPTSFDQLLLILKILLTYIAKQATLMRRSKCIEPSPSVSVPWLLL